MTKREAKRLACHIASRFLQSDVDNGGLLGSLPEYGVALGSDDDARVHAAMDAVIEELALRGWAETEEAP